MRALIRLCSKVTPKESLLIFDCGGNTLENKRKNTRLKFHYLTLKAKKKGPYRKEIAVFHCEKVNRVSFFSNNRAYSCVKNPNGEETRYVFYSEDLERDPLSRKAEKFERDLKKGMILSKKVEGGKDLGQYIAPKGWIIARGHLQKTLGEIPNPYVTGLEGFFVLESSIDDEPENILDSYKNRDLAEKFIRDLKRGAEMRPIRHWSKYAVIGFVLIVFLTKVLVSLTQFFCKNPLVKNLKVLKIFLTNLTLTIVYPYFGFGFRFISNFLPELHPLFGDFIKRYGCLQLPNRW